MYRKYFVYIDDGDEVYKIAIAAANEDTAKRTCIRCGKPATKISLGWISPWCDSCIERIKGHERFEDIETYFRSCEDCAYYDTDESDMPCVNCVDTINFEPMVTNDE